MEPQLEYLSCKSCGAVNRAGARFCHQCGKSLTESSAPLEPVKVATAMPPAPVETTAPPAQPNVPPVPAPAPANVAETQSPALASAPAVSSETEGRLAPGARLLDRFEVLEVIESANGVARYRARDALRCSACHTENQPSDLFCGNCGRELGETRGTCILEESRAPQDMASVAANAFVEGDRLYVVQFEPPHVEAKKPFARGVYLAFGCKSDAGLARSDAPDEDSVFAAAFSAIYESVAQPTVGLFIVADGIGGSDAGEIASQACVQTVVADLMTRVIAPMLTGEEIGDEAARDAIKAAIQSGNDKVSALAREKKVDMGTTITLALVINDNAYIANVGDSRTYLLAGNKMEQITRDHSLVANLVAKGEIQPEEIYTHPHRNYILRSLGANAPVEIDVFPAEGGALKLPPGARLLLCCDGLWEMVRDDELERFLFGTDAPQTICEHLVTRANENGGEDNISVVAVSIA